LLRSRSRLHSRGWHDQTDTRCGALRRGAGIAHLGSAQTFKVDKWDIGGTGGTDYLVAEPGTGRVFDLARTHVMVIDGATGKVLGDIPDTPRMHGIGLAPKWNHGFTTNGGDSSVTMFDLTTLAAIKKIAIKVGGLDGIMYDEFSDRIILTNHSRPGTAVALDANSGEIVGTAVLEDNAPEGAASDGKGKLFVNNETQEHHPGARAMTMKVLASWPLAPCEGPTGIAFDKPRPTGSSPDAATSRSCSTRARARSSRASPTAMAWTHSAAMARKKLIYIPAGDAGQRGRRAAGRTEQVHHGGDGPHDEGAKTIAVDPIRHVAYLFQPEFGPLPAGTPAPAPGQRGRAVRIVAAWFFAITH
jgi:hypothetical protein